MKKKTGGMTMVEVIVAFAILMIGLAGMYKITLMSGNMIAKASSIQKQVDDLMNQYYEGKLTDTEVVQENIKITDEAKKELITITPVIKYVENSEGYRIYYYEKSEESGE